MLYRVVISNWKFKRLNQREIFNFVEYLHLILTHVRLVKAYTFYRTIHKYESSGMLPKAQYLLFERIVWLILEDTELKALNTFACQRNPTS